MNILFTILIWFTSMGMFVSTYPVEAKNEHSVDFEKIESPYLFNIMNMAPGEEITKTFTVYNDDRIKRVPTIKGIVKNESGSLSKVLDISINQGNKRIYGFKPLKDFFVESSHRGIILSAIQPHSKSSYQITVRFQQRAGNIYQNKHVSFNLKIEYPKSQKRK